MADENILLKTGKLYISPVGTVDMTDVAEIKGATGWTLIGRTRGMASNISMGDNKKIRADDGLITSLSKPFGTITSTFLENANIDLLDTILPGTKSTGTGYELFQIDHSVQEMPKVSVKMVEDRTDGDSRIIYLASASFEGEYLQEFIDAYESGDIQGATLTFVSNEGGKYGYYNEVGVS